MGCWNGTCMVTNLPILVGDPVVCQVIVSSPFTDPLKSAGDTCGPNDRFVPVGWALRAKYNDYGYVEHIEDSPYATDTLSYLRDIIIERPLGENPYHDHEVSKDKLSWESLDNWLHGKRVLLRNPYAFGDPKGLHPRERSAGMAMIHQPVYEAMAAYRNGWERGDIDATIKEALAMATGGEFSAVNEFIVRDKLSRFIRDREMHNPYDLQGGDIDETARRLAEMVNFDIGLSYMRKQWMPISGAGSQSEEWPLFRKIAEIGSAIAERREKDLAEDDEEDDID